MRDPNRIPTVLGKLAQVWHLYPDMRLGQLVFNLARYGEPEPRDVFNVEDEELLAKMELIFEDKRILEKKITRGTRK